MNNMPQHTVFWENHPRILCPNGFTPELLEAGPVMVHFIRHAHAPLYKNIPDPELTPLIGLEQCRGFSEAITRPELIHRIECSPLTRSIQTAKFAFARVWETKPEDVHVVANPNLKSFCPTVRGTGKDPAVLLEEYRIGDDEAGFRIGLGLLSPGWSHRCTIEDMSLVGPEGSKLHKVLSRLVDIRKWNKHRQRLEIIIISHGSIFDDLLDNNFVKSTDAWLDSVSYLFDGVKLVHHSTREVNAWRGAEAKYADSLF